MRGPIGLDLGGRAASETALAILAEVVAERRGGSGVPMSERAGSRAASVTVPPALRRSVREADPGEGVR